MRLLDIGCGWGSLVAFAAERYGVDAIGVTLSEAQAGWAAAEIERRGLGGRASVELRDYRDLGRLGTFDAVASVGMFEHVGRERLADYFAAALASVRPGGLFLNHGIATTAIAGGLRPRRQRFDRGGFVGRYVFPDGELVTVEEAIGFARRAGFELIDASASGRTTRSRSRRGSSGSKRRPSGRSSSSTWRSTGPGGCTWRRAARLRGRLARRRAAAARPARRVAGAAAPPPVVVGLTQGPLPPPRMWPRRAGRRLPSGPPWRPWSSSC